MFSWKLSVDQTAGIVSVILGIATIIGSIRLYPLRQSFLMGDHVIPLIVGGVLVLLGGLLTFTVKRNSFKVELPEKEMLKKMGFIFFLLFATVFLFYIAGYEFGTLVSTFFLFREFGSYSWKKSGSFAFILTAILYLIFVYWFQIPFPMGVIIQMVIS